jgi:hypothetical protein
MQLLTQRAAVDPESDQIWSIGMCICTCAMCVAQCQAYLGISMLLSDEQLSHTKARVRLCEAGTFKDPNS